MPVFVHAITGLSRTPKGVALFPGVRYFSERVTRPGLRHLVAGSPLEVRLAGGGTVATVAVHVGVARGADRVACGASMEDPVVLVTVPADIGPLPVGSELWLLDGSVSDTAPRPLTRRELETAAFTRYSALSSSERLSPEQLVALIDDGILLHRAGRITNEQRLRRLKNMAVRALPGHEATNRIQQYLASLSAAHRAD